MYFNYPAPLLKKRLL